MQIRNVAVIHYVTKTNTEIVMPNLKRVVAAAIAASFALTSTVSVFAQTPLKKLGKPEGQVDIVAWPGYIERGETDKAYDWVTDFEKKSGCKVNVKTVPCGWLDSNTSAPPCCSTTVRHRLRPNPMPSALVVKNGLNS